MARYKTVRVENQAGHKDRVRVLQIVESLDSRAVESWLMRIFRHAVVDYPHFEWTFFCVLPEAGEFDDVVRAAGGHVLHSRHPLHNKISFFASLRKVMREGHYDILHCHHDILSAAYLAASLGLPFRRRIIHFHNTAVALPTPSRAKNFFFHTPMRKLCLRAADRIVGISNDALVSIIGSAARKAGRDLVVHYGVDTDHFTQLLLDATEFRHQLGFASNAKVLLFVGRMVEYKNPCFALEVLEVLQRSDPDFVGVFVGKGPLEGEVRELARAKNIENKVRVLGFRDDVPQIMQACDVLIWPSAEEPKEGLGLGVVEAQAAGLPVLMSLSVPAEAVVIPELVRALPLSQGAEEWAREVQRMSRANRPSKAEALSRVENSSFSMSEGVASLMALYEFVN